MRTAPRPRVKCDTTGVNGEKMTQSNGWKLTHAGCVFGVLAWPTVAEEVGLPEWHDNRGGRKDCR